MKCYNCSKEIEEAEICPYCEKNQICTTLDFNIKGTTFENENGKDIQKEIRKTFLEYERNGCFEKYSGYTNAEIKEFVTEVAEFEDAEVEIELKEDIYEEKPCIKIYIKRYDNSFCHVGYMPKGLIRKYLKLKKHFKEMKVSANLAGGKIKTLEYDPCTDKEIVVTQELNYGFEVSLAFYNDEDKFQKQAEKRKQKTIEQWEATKRESENKEEEKDKQKEIEKKKTNAKIGLAVYIFVFIISFHIMPLGIITLIWSIIGIVVCLAMLF